MPSSSSLRRATATVLTALALLAGLGQTPASGAFTSCTALGTTVTAIADAASPSTLSVGGGGAILADGAPCAGATVAGTDLVQILNAAPGPAPAVTIDLSGGAFAPGATDEPGSTSDEIEFHVAFAGIDLAVLTIAGGDGPDHLVAGAAGLNLNAAEPDDDVDVTYLVTGTDYGGAIIDRMLGRDGDDVLSNAGGEGTGAAWPFSTPLLDGGAGDDVIRAGEEDALMVGGPDDDLLVGGPDDLDELRGGPGFDLLEGSGGDDILDGGPDEDWAAYTNAPGPVTARLPGGTEPGTDGYGATDVYVAIERLSGSPHDDRLTGDGGANIVNGQGGDDVIVLRGGSDLSRGGEGDDTIDGGPGEDGISGDDGADLLEGGGADDDISDGPGNDVVLGGGGDDTLDASGFDPDFGLLPSGADLLRGGPGTDTVHYWPRATGVTVTLDGLANDGAPGEADNVGGPGGDVENVEGGFGDDVLVGARGANRLDGLGGGDTLEGGEGRDTLVGGAGEDVLLGGDGRDELFADDGEADMLDGGPRRDTADVDALDVVSSVETVT